MDLARETTAFLLLFSHIFDAGEKHSELVDRENIL